MSHSISKQQQHTDTARTIQRQNINTAGPFVNDNHESSYDPFPTTKSMDSYHLVGGEHYQRRPTEQSDKMEQGQVSTFSLSSHFIQSQPCFDLMQQNQQHRLLLLQQQHNQKSHNDYQQGQQSQQKVFQKELLKQDHQLQQQHQLLQLNQHRHQQQQPQQRHLLLQQRHVQQQQPLLESNEFSKADSPLPDIDSGCFVAKREICNQKRGGHKNILQSYHGQKRDFEEGDHAKAKADALPGGFRREQYHPPYRDLSKVYDSDQLIRMFQRHPTTNKENFPVILHMLVETCSNATTRQNGIVCWHQHGRAFQITDKSRFTNEILPLFFPSQTRYSSFHRQLNYYGFLRLSGTEVNTFYHEAFLQGRLHLAYFIQRSRHTSGASRQAFNFESEPDFTQMSPVAISHDEYSPDTEMEPLPMITEKYIFVSQAEKVNANENLTSEYFNASPLHKRVKLRHRSMNRNMHIKSAKPFSKQDSLRLSGLVSQQSGESNFLLSCNVWTDKMKSGDSHVLHRSKHNDSEVKNNPQTIFTTDDTLSDISSDCDPAMVFFLSDVDLS
jgi:HSF-type DNA-binding